MRYFSHVLRLTLTGYVLKARQASRNDSFPENRCFFQFRGVGLLVFDTERIFGPERVESLRLLTYGAVEREKHQDIS